MGEVINKTNILSLKVLSFLLIFILLPFVIASETTYGSVYEIEEIDRKELFQETVREKLEKQALIYKVIPTEKGNEIYRIDSEGNIIDEDIPLIISSINLSSNYYDAKIYESQIQSQTVKQGSGEGESSTRDMDCNNAYYLDWEDEGSVTGWYPPNEYENHWFEIDLPNDDEFLIGIDMSNNDDFDLYVHPECNDGWVCRPYDGTGDTEICYVDNLDGDVYIRIHAYYLGDDDPYYLYIYPLEGNNDYCDIWDDWGVPCEEGEWDCESDSDCESGLDCMGPYGDYNPNYYDGCCEPGDEWDANSHECISGGCEEGWLNEYDCGSGNMRKRLYQNSDCSTDWENWEDCDDYDTGWDYFCSGDCIQREETDYYCSDSSNSCQGSYDQDTLSCNGDSDYCDDRYDHQDACGKCGYEDYDCDWNSECSGSLECTGPIWGALDGCCNPGEQWDGSGNCGECFADSDCDDQNYYSGWNYECGSNYVKKYRTFYDFGCSGGNDCVANQINEEEIYYNGNSDYCSKSIEFGCGGCDYEQYDCDWNSECSGSLECTGPIWGALDGCCNPGEQWDGSGNCGECFADSDCNSQDYYSEWYYECGYDYVKKYRIFYDYSCSGGNDCIVNEIVEEIIYNNGNEDYCDKSLEYGCGACGYEQYDCDSNSECSGSLECMGSIGGALDGCCNPNEEWDEVNYECIFNTVCGDGICSPDEYCVQDCLVIDSFIDNPDSVDYGEPVSVTVKVDNIGTVTLSENIEAGIVPESWAGLIYPDRSSTPISGCCDANEYYDSFHLEISPGQSEYVTFSIIAPNPDSIDNCGDGGSAWDSSFNLISGLYVECFEGYTDFTSTEIDVSYEPPCNNNGICEEWESFETCSSDCVCNGNGICDGLETFDTCASECYCDFDGTCDSFQGENEYTCAADCVPDCDIPDGSSYACDCDSNIECPSGLFCNFVSGPDACEEINYEDECSNYNDYYCNSGNVFQCVFESTNYVEELVDVCTSGEFCDSQVVSGTGECSLLPVHLDLWIDYAPVGLTVNKQVGDVFTVNIYAEQSTTVDLQYSAVFSGDCPLGSYSLDTGVNSCELSVNSGFGNYIISVNDNVVTLNIVSEPSLIVVTNVEKLFERFPYEERGVEATLSQTYENSVSNSVVYDLSKYISGHPFNSFSNYNEHVDNLNMMDNSYTVEASEFIKEKCNGCSDIMILGDDYVIPGYRRIIDEYLTEWLWFNGVAVESVITTDIPYIEKEVLLFSEYFEIFRQGSGYQGKNVLVIHPANEDSSMSDSIEGLKTAFVDRGFDPDFTDISGDTIYCVDESWSSDASGKTLILIGSEEDNNAFSCLPFIQADLDNYSAAHLLPNVWDTDEFALVINTDDPAVIESFASMVREQQLENLGSETAYFFNMGTQYVGYGALVLGAGLIIAGTGGAAAPAGLILIGGIANVAADSTDVANTCYVNYDSMGWCGGTIALAAIPVLPSKPVKAFIRQIKDFNFNQIVNLQLVDDVMKKSIKYFQPDDLKNVIKNEETLELFSDGKHFLIGGDDITSIKVAEFNNIKKEHLAEGFVNLKRLDLDNAYLDPDWLTQLRMQGGNPGFWAELKHASDQIDNFDKVIVGKRHVGLNIDMDVLLKKEGVQEAILDEVKNYNSLLEIEEFNLGDDLYKQLTARIGSIGTTVEVAGDTLTITNVRLIVRENTPIGPNLQTFLDENPSMELIRFRGVDWP